LEKSLKEAISSKITGKPASIAPGT